MIAFRKIRSDDYIFYSCIPRIGNYTCEPLNKLVCVSSCVRDSVGKCVFKKHHTTSTSCYVDVHDTE